MGGSIIRPLLILLSCLLSACASLISSQTAKLADNLALAVLNSNDPATVRDGAPAYLLMIDGLIAGDPGNTGLLLAGADLYSAYAGVFVEDEARRQRLTETALTYSTTALCGAERQLCEVRDMPFAALQGELAQTDRRLLPELYTLGVAWAGWIQARDGDWNAVAELARVQLLLETVAARDGTYRDGMAHLYLGGLATLLPPALGGKPAIGREHFEKAIAFSGGKNLMVKVTFAERYARLVFDRELHDQLLREVMDTAPEVPGYTLMNVLAQAQAEQLLASADDYF
ncbi:hypothetical protein FKG94_07745 [Exilibacterium tricleocarpae]|uniref:TRAP transporter TatT component family protein n=1 Tax=Exilibacterium tricleocarpae TaxID=2591008 RepID=A0A545TZJ8_9GAMM|nr:hypothetical protein FKG94_07745 [Exilibacterium tricleocarpae]